MYQPAPGKPYAEPCILIHDQRLQVVQSFAYLGSILCNTSTIDLEPTTESPRRALRLVD